MAGVGREKSNSDIYYIVPDDKVAVENAKNHIRALGGVV